MNPFNLRGPDFLVFYVALFVVVTGCAAALRWLLRFPDDAPGPEALDLTPSEVAFLAGGEERTVNAAIVRLVHDRAVEIDASARRLAQAENATAASAPELEQVICSAAAKEGGVSIAKVRDKARTALAQIRARLEELGLIVDRDRQWAATGIPVGVTLIAPIVGLIKIVIGMARERPVGGLVFLCVLSVVFAFAAFARPVRRSRRGDRVLEQLKETNAAMEYQAQRRIESIASNDLTLALGLFGMGILAGGPLAQIEAALQPPKNKSGGDQSWSDWGGWSWGGSSCGGSSCGSSCGGGCGGGGCGGCGG